MHRSALFTLVEAIELAATSAERTVVEAVEFLRALRGAKAAFVPEEMTVERPGPAGEAPGDTRTVRVRIDADAFASGQWRKTLRDKNRPGMLVRRHLEVCVFSYLAAELRSGDIAVAGSDSFANLHDQLMSWQECRPLVPAICAQAGIPAEASALTAHYRDKLAAVAAAVDATPSTSWTWPVCGATGRRPRPTARRSTPGRTICWPRPASATAGTGGSPTGTSPTPTSRCSPGSSCTGCGRRSTSSRA
nr:hypothetical protein [Microbispora triticiradicis]